MKSHWLYIIFLIVSFSSCQYPWGHYRSDVTEEINGNYKFKYPSGEVEVLSIREDSTYKRVLYKKESHYLRKHEPKFVNEGTWQTNGKAVLFNNWMEYCYLMNPDSLLAEPEITESQEADWFSANDGYKARIEIWLDSNYILIKED